MSESIYLQRPRTGPSRRYQPDEPRFLTTTHLTRHVLVYSTVTALCLDHETPSPISILVDGP